MMLSPYFPLLRSRLLAPRFVSALLLAALPVSLAAVQTESVVHETYQHFLDGELKNVSLHRDGRLRLAPRVSEIGSLAEAVIWSAVAGPEGTLFIGAGNEGKVYAFSPGGEVEELADTEQVFVRALAVDDRGRLYFGSSPDGKVYRVGDDGETEVFFDPRETYIWSLQFGPGGDLFVATGDQGRVYRVPAGAEAGSAGEVYFDGDESHISTLAWDEEGRLLAGTSPNGYVYRLAGKGEAFLLFNSPDEEVRRIVPGSDGNLFVATFSSGGQGSETSGRAGSLAEALAALASGEKADGAGESNPPGASSDENGGKRPGTIYRVTADGFYEPFWGLPGVSIHSLLRQDDGTLLVGTGDEGRLFSLAGFQSWELRQTLPAGNNISAMLQAPDSSGVFALTSHPARIYELDFDLAGEGEYVSPVFDAKQVAKWGHFYAEAPGAGRDNFEASVRSGNSEKADATWTPWQAVEENAADVEPGRYFQYRLALKDGDVAVRRVRFFYQHANAAPVIAAVRVVIADLGLEQFEMPPQQPAVDLDQLFRGAGTYSPSESERRAQIRAYESPGAVTAAWQARDGNDDELVFTVQLRRAGDESWHTIAADLAEPFFSFNGNGYAEGSYQVQVIASDRRSNLSGTARETRRLSELFVIDNTGPEIAVDEVTTQGSSAAVVFGIGDETSMLAGADYVLDGAETTALFPDDGIYDEREEHFRLELDGLETGRHTLVIRAVDEARNSRVRQVTIEVGEQR